MAKETIKSATLKPKNKGDKEIRISIEEITNGFLITRNTEWTDSKGIYHYDTTKTYTAENPLDKNKSLADVFKE